MFLIVGLRNELASIEVFVIANKKTNKIIFWDNNLIYILLNIIKITKFFFCKNVDLNRGAFFRCFSFALLGESETGINYEKQSWNMLGIRIR